MTLFYFGDAIHAMRDYIRLAAITYQSFGLDKNKALHKEVLYFWCGRQGSKIILYFLYHLISSNILEK